MTIVSGNKSIAKSRTRAYVIWKSMKQRCYDPKINRYAFYGGAGITVCERWHIFENFLADMGEPPSEKHTLDRKNNLLGYSPENCRWATKAEQANNRSNNKLITFNGKTQSMSQWAKELGISYKKLKQRIRSVDLGKTSLYHAFRCDDIKHRIYSFEGQSKCLTEWANEKGINVTTLHSRINKQGMSFEKAISFRLTSEFQPQCRKKIIEIDEERLTLPEWAEKMGVNPTTIYNRAKKNNISNEQVIREHFENLTSKKDDRS